MKDKGAEEGAEEMFENRQLIQSKDSREDFKLSERNGDPN